MGFALADQFALMTAADGGAGAALTDSSVMLDITPVMSDITAMIESFRDKRTAAVFQGKLPKGFPSDAANVARRKLRMLDASVRLDDLRVPPGNRLEALSGSRKGQHSIRVNDQWRVCFVWRDGGAHNVEVCDYH